MTISYTTTSRGMMHIYYDNMAIEIAGELVFESATFYGQFFALTQ